MFATDDTVVAIATPPGRGGIGVVRMSGPDVVRIAAALLDLRAALVPRYATVARTRVALDETVATYFEAPRSYTGEDVVEISAHGSPLILQSIVRAAIDAGARLAAPGEFTLRAFLNGKRDLIQAEAVGDLIAAATPLQARTAFDQLDGTLTGRIAGVDARLFDVIARLEASLDFPEEGYHFIDTTEVAGALGATIADVDALLGDARRGRMIREGATLVIAGRPNVGKSSLFNRLLGSDRAIVTPVPGTTRDLVTELLDIEGLAVSVVDTAGWRLTDDLVEIEGVARGERARAVADLTLVVLDQSEQLVADDHKLLEATAASARLIVWNKSDLPRESQSGADGEEGASVHGADNAAGIRVSAVTNEGVAHLRRAIATALTGSEALRDTAALSNIRHIELLAKVRTHLAEAREAARRGDTPEEFLLTHLIAARERLDEVVGARTSEDMLRHIFETFCIGK